MQRNFATLFFFSSFSAFKSNTNLMIRLFRYNTIICFDVMLCAIFRSFVSFTKNKFHYNWIIILSNRQRRHKKRTTYTKLETDSITKLKNQSLFSDCSKCFHFIRYYFQCNSRIHGLTFVHFYFSYIYFSTPNF